MPTRAPQRFMRGRSCAKARTGSRFIGSMEISDDAETEENRRAADRSHHDASVLKIIGLQDRRPVLVSASGIAFLYRV